MSRVWTVVLSVWAMLAIVAVLAWTQRPATPFSQASGQTVVVKTVHGKRQLVVLQTAAAPHATTSTSPVR
jgi:cyanate permease